MGKIVEKAIFLKYLKMREHERINGTLNNADLILELGNNDQLTKEDVELALSDSTVVPKPLYNSADSALNPIDGAQIYCGPGFEERIEVEMEQ